MDIKIGNPNRLRLSHDNCESLKNGINVTETFKLTTDIRFNIEVSIGETGSGSKLTYNNETLRFLISQSDLELISIGRLKNTGLLIENYIIQIDLWNKNLRDRNEAHRL